jgi:hypothetical protein
MEPEATHWAVESIGPHVWPTKADTALSLDTKESHRAVPGPSLLRLAARPRPSSAKTLPTPPQRPRLSLGW